MTTIACKIFPNEDAARGALHALEANWTPPTLTNIGGGRHMDHALIPPLTLTEPSEMEDGRWVLYGDHPSMKEDTITTGELRRNVAAAQHALNGTQNISVPETPGAESGVVVRPGVRRKTG